MKTVTVSALEFEGLKNLEQVVRIALKNQGTGEFIVGALRALDAIRRDEAGDAAAPVISSASTLASDLIQRSMRKEIE